MKDLIYYQNKASKFACNKYGFKIEEAIMSEKLSNAQTPICPYCSTQLSPDVSKLAEIIYINKRIDLDISMAKEVAQEIINKMNVWIVKESSGQCNHEFMQQYDFSKFSNAGNSLKCVKCGLIKKG